MGDQDQAGKYYRGRKIYQGMETGLMDQIQEQEVRVSYGRAEQHRSEAGVDLGWRWGYQLGLS